MARIELSKLAHSYSTEPESAQNYALKEMNFAWADGEAYALLGPSGCGKTTLLNIISGLLTPSRGRVLYDGKDVTHLDPADRNIAQVFQFPVVYDTMTVADNLAFPLRNRGLAESVIAKRVAEIGEMLDLSHVMGKRAAGLAADQKQKISMGRGLVRDDVAAILFDEPLTVIDPYVKWQLRRKLKEIHVRFGHTLVYVTHDQNEALTFADKVVVMLDGEVVQLGTPQELFEQPAHRFVGYFIGSPGMNFLPCRITQEGLAIEGTRLTMGGIWADRAMGKIHSKLEIGIRPEFLKIQRDESADSVPVQVLKVEDLGKYQLATVGFGPHAIKAKLPAGADVPPDLAHMLFDPERTKLYADGLLVT